MNNPFMQESTNKLLKTRKDLLVENTWMQYPRIIKQNLMVIAAIDEVLAFRSVKVK